MDSINKLICSFVEEAMAAPNLFEDLSKVEEYIAETYKNRSFIELIQNADDAESTSFGIHKTSFGFVVCNNGRPFNNSDLEAICRSGSSNKQRGGNTIGFRGIGFKSVVGLAKQIVLLSGDYQICFDKNRSKQLLHTENTPVVRIPHITDILTTLYSEEIDLLKRKYDYTTIFAFIDIDLSVLNSEVSRFDYSCLLFLNHILNVNIETEQKTSFIRLVRENVNVNQFKIKAKENDNIIAEWILFRSEQSAKDIVAFKFKDNSIVPAIGSESVMHSFMPSIEFTGAFLKINGDFSTDPSRKSIDLDTYSKTAIENCANIVAVLIKNVLLGKQDMRGLFLPFINTLTETKSAGGKLFINKIEDSLHVDNKLNLNNLRLCPQWLPYEDYESLCYRNFGYLNKIFVTNYPESIIYLENFGIQSLSLKEILGLANTAVISKVGASQILSKVISQYYFDMTTENIDFIKSLKLFPVQFKSGLHKVTEFSKLTELDDKCLDFISNTNEKSDLASFFKKLDIELPQKSMREATGGYNLENKKSAISSPPLNEQTLFIKAPQIQCWRSAEENLVEYLKCIQEVEQAIDVASANIGYDIEVLFTNGKRVFVEVKSVSFFGESFKITNNEYSTAHNYQDQYYLALVVNNADFQVMFIQNPISNLTLDKQCERWSWICNSMVNNILSTENFITNNTL